MLEPDDESAVDDLVAAPARGSEPRRHRDRFAHGRRADPPLQLSRSSRARAAPRPCARAPGRAGRRQDRDARVERLSPFRALLRRLRHGSGHPHDQPAAVSGPDHLHRQPCRRSLLLFRSELRAARRAARPAMQGRQGLDRDDRSRAHAVADASRTCFATKSCSPRRAMHSTGPNSTRTPPPACATRRAPPATRRVSCTATGRPCCMPTRPRCRTPRISPREA